MKNIIQFLFKKRETKQGVPLPMVIFYVCIIVFIVCLFLENILK